jgi:cathepsin X
MKIAAVLTLASSVQGTKYMNEIKIMENHKKRSHVVSPLPHTYLVQEAIPDNFSWGDVDGKSYLTKQLNQHIPHYCGSCWAHGAISSLADRIKIARGGEGLDINLSIQYILNCGGDTAGSCHGGYHTGVFELIQSTGFVPYETCMPYLACSEESQEGFCPHVDTTCSAINTCRTCSGFSDSGGECVELDYFPNATIAEYGEIGGDLLSMLDSQATRVHKIKAEIYQRGPVACTINAEPLRDYEGGILDDESASTSSNHIVSIVGFGKDAATGQGYWIIRNSWGEYWGEMGFAKIATGKNMLGIEDHVAWATPGTFTTENAMPCSEDGAMCGGEAQGTSPYVGQMYVDPSVAFAAREAEERSGLRTQK